MIIAMECLCKIHHGKMLEIVCESQMIYSHGKCMCTTACMTLLIALLSRNIDMSVIDDLYMRRWLKSIMKVANGIHATLDSRPKSISVSDYINIIGIEQTIPDARVVEYIINNELGNDVCYHFVSTTFFVCTAMFYRYCWY
jgi:hypothetical protein